MPMYGVEYSPDYIRSFIGLAHFAASHKLPGGFNLTKRGLVSIHNTLV